jgi:hypothetical protein
MRVLQKLHHVVLYVNHKVLVIGYHHIRSLAFPRTRFLAGFTMTYGAGRISISSRMYILDGDPNFVSRVLRKALFAHLSG